MGKKTPVQKFGVPEDISSVVEFLIENKYITGQNIVVDGGRMLI